jgi:hypothetical protein
VTTQCAPCGQGRLAWPAPAHFTIVVVVDDPKAGAATASTTPNVISTKASFLMTAALPTVVQSPRPASLLGERARLRQSLEFPTSLRWSYRTSPSRPARPVQPRSRPKTHWAVLPAMLVRRDPRNVFARNRRRRRQLANRTPSSAARALRLVNRRSRQERARAGGSACRFVGDVSDRSSRPCGPTNR